MKAKQFIFVAVAVAILVSAVAIPVAAEDEIPMYVHSIRMTLKGRDISPSAKLVGTVAVRDANNEPVAGATVGVEFVYPGQFGDVHWLTQGETSAQGTVSFRVNAAYSGTYELCVLNITKDGWEYFANLNRETCETYDVP